MSSQSVVVVTGAAGALGRALSEHFLGQGAAVVAADLDWNALQNTYGDQPHVRTVAVDLTDCDAAQRLLGVLGPVSALCNIAGGFDMGQPVHQTPDTMWRRLFDLNVATLINASRALVPAMMAAGTGKIVNVAAAAAVSGKGGMGAYCASKDSVARLTESMALELRDSGINVNAVAPSIIDTPANRAAMPDADASKWVALADLASVIGFLVSPQAKALNGAVIPVVGRS
jgi:NAD(P)-dependent dehydrogenase (short-subunit alcohol dehydrogenase family)